MKKLLSVLVSVVLVASLAACTSGKTASTGSTSNSTEQKSEGTKTLGFSIDQLFESRAAVVEAAKGEAEKNGYKVIEVVADGDAQNQNSQIESLISQKVDAILVCAVDQNTIETALVKAKNAGIPIVAFDRDLPESKSINTFVGPDSIADGLAAGEYMVEQLKDQTGEIVVLELLGALNDQNGIDRSKGFNEAFKALPNAKIIQMPTDWDSQKALDATQNAFQANGDIRAVYCATDTQIPSVETVLTDMGKLKLVGEDGHVVVCGINGSKDGYEATVKGVSDGIVVMDLKTTGETAVQNAIDLIGGKTIDTDTVIPGQFYSNKDIEANKDKIWGVQ
ncbi:sugar ABC transporter substrate-binding protein [Clostridium grantii]|uniref:Ribose transport system substrate-binding protein n=1 Tax=Clostridium grantii DSM 8605 TaxID=1121316 RepID=A0A1M5V6N4_9CLOT|nr:sugar ABC transporter substrate-binding protein [Clostridium grantii]SHH70754.1 ribose transport system substrate-binding protein [Clostridium grantii DSM 8605]